MVSIPAGWEGDQVRLIASGVDDEYDVRVDGERLRLSPAGRQGVERLPIGAGGATLDLVAEARGPAAAPVSIAARADLGLWLEVHLGAAVSEHWLEPGPTDLELAP